MGKITALFVAALSAVVLLSGCGEPPNHWYKTTKGYINLTRVTTVTTDVTLIVNDGKNRIVLMENEAVNSETVEKVLKKLENQEISEVLAFHGCITFDAIPVMFAITDKDGKTVENKKIEKLSKEDIKRNLEDWLDIADDLKANLP